MAGGITEDTINQACAWLVQHGHSLAGIAHPQGEQGRFMAAVALELNVPGLQLPETARLVVDCIAYLYSEGTVCTHVA